MNQALQKHIDKLRFIIVGSGNTILDISILLCLTTSFSVSKEVANIISTSVSFLFSFFMNRAYTFRSKSPNIKKQFILFAIVTLFGLWVIQTFIITMLTPLFISMGMSEHLALLSSKLIATTASLTWNYILYAIVVFKV